MFATAYRYLTELGAPVIDMYLRRRLAAGREDAARFSERLGRASWPRPGGFLIWCHAASVGEAVSLLSLIDKIRQFYPAVNVLITTGTVTSARMLDGRLPEGVLHQYIPVDRLPYVKEFLDHWRPDLVLWVESELWPNMLMALKERNVPAVLLNARMSDKSFRQWYRVRSLAKQLLGTFNLSLTQTEDERGRFVTLGAKPVRCIGNLKYAAQPLPHNLAELERLSELIEHRFVWLMASTHRGEEEMAIDIHRQLKDRFPLLLTIIVPRHAVRGDEIAADLAKSGLKITRRSKGEVLESSTDVYLADTMGELGLFYRLSPITVMGGTFVPVGGHNPIEAARLGTALLFGPSMYNFSEITREFLGRKAARQVQHINELTYILTNLLTNDSERQDLARHASMLADDKSHVLDDILEAIKPWLPVAAKKAAEV
jgi:3-deoxy-D-manno-octulosonic-acid transferase